MTNPIIAPDDYDAIVLAGVRSPGVVTLSGHQREQGWDVQEAKGQTGASTKHNGDKVAQFTATFRLVYDPTAGIDDFADWDETFQPVIESSTSGKTPIALDVYHPDLAACGIKSVVNGGIGGKQHDGKGGATIAVKLLEYRPPKPKSSTGANGSKGGTKDSRIEDKINQLNEELKNGGKKP
jgi:hypothetical protein